MKINRNVAYLVVALGLGLAAAYASMSYIQSEVAARVQHDETAPVAVPKFVMEPGQVLAQEDLAVREIPADLVPADAVTPANFDMYMGRALRAPLKMGTPISSSVLVPLHEQFSQVIRPGHVGYTLQVDETNSISGMLAPGDRVDILFSLDDEKAGARVVPLLENILVLATGTRIRDSVAQEDDMVPFSNVTLELAPRDAERLAVASKAGDLRVILRHHEDGNSYGLKGLTQRELLRGKRSGNNVRQGVEYIIGGGS